MWALISDRIGGLATVLIGSVWQASIHLVLTSEVRESGALKICEQPESVIIYSRCFNL